MSQDKNSGSIATAFPISVEILSQLHHGKSLHAILATIDWSSAALRAKVLDWVYSALRSYYFSHAVLTKNCRTFPDTFISVVLILCIAKLRRSPDVQAIVVHTGVEYVRVQLQSESVAAFVNAVLRNFLRQEDKLTAELLQKEYILAELPEVWMPKIKKKYPHSWKDIALILQGHPPMTVRVNALVYSDVSVYQKLLKQQEINSQVLFGHALQLDTPISQAELPGYDVGHVSVQDANAQKAVSFLQIEDGHRLLDACTAPGGKCMAILEQYKHISCVSVDVDASRLKVMEQLLRRLGLDQRTKLVCADVSETSQWWDGQMFDRILLDVPCSGSGSLRRHLEYKLHQRTEDFPKTLFIQMKMMRSLWPLLLPGGILLYVTCSMFLEENEVQIEKFCKSRKDAKVMRLSDEDSEGPWGLSLSPTAQADGFFYACLKKIS